MSTPVEEAQFLRVTPGWIAATVFAWLVTTVVALTLVVYALGPMVQAGDQRAALGRIRGDLDRALGASQSLLGAPPPATPAEFGAPVAVLEVPKLKLRQVVLEGVSSAETASGPGHVPGTSGPGQPGNAAVVGRYAGYGHPFASLASLASGDELVVATAQGVSVYRVSEVATRALDETADYGKTPDDRLTLVTSASWWPLAATEATVVTAKLEGRPFRPTPQNGRADAQDGRTGDPGAWAALVLAFGGFVAAAAGATLLYRRWRPVSTYVITAPVLLTLAALAALALWRLFPAWA
ncbi:sortase [Amycolatopsis vancoresmycina]|uniref:Sortase-like protein n=1 Tax=Amycolatopsis vancoresmycina DSM 44592 TaxID=1292037 RepID=R1FKG2_9PSEU|nr:sortase [Amycolatopsis vancoresmycina]EOD60038.1 sortase-like protein [Amycolatopsis vancoresmycina DSM 44592]